MRSGSLKQQPLFRRSGSWRQADWIKAGWVVVRGRIDPARNGHELNVFRGGGHGEGGQSGWVGGSSSEPLLGGLALEHDGHAQMHRSHPGIDAGGQDRAPWGLIGRGGTKEIGRAHV